jgi:hypothetical protein
VSVLTASRPRLASRWRSFEAWVGTRSSAAALFVVALAVFALESVVLPAYPGRDMARYVQTFVQLGYHVPVYPAVLNTRGPLAALGVGVPLEIGGWTAEVWLALLYAFSIVAWGRVALTFGSRAAVLTAGLLLAYPGYGILFHELASDALFAAAFAGWAVLLARAIQRPSVAGFLIAGGGMGVLVLVRPANQVLIVMALLPLLLRAPWRERLAWLAAFFVASVTVTQGWKALAELRYGAAVALKPSTAAIGAAVVLVPLLLPARWRGRIALVVALLVVAVVAVKGWPGQSPAQDARSLEQSLSNQFLYRAFELDRIFSPDNGPASRKVSRVVQRDLLTREPYRSYGVGVHEFFSSGSDRVFGDMTGVVNGADLAAATREAIRRHPKAFATSVARTLWDQISRRPLYAPESVGGGGEAAAPQQATQFIVVNGRRLPRPSEGQPIPASAIGPVLWTPGGPAREVWRSPTKHQTVFADSRDQRRFEKFGRDVERLSARIPTRNAHPELVRRLNQASHRFPPPVAWLVVGLVALALRRPRRALVALAPSVAGVVVIVATSLVAPSVAEYAVPVSPAFLMLAAVGLVGAPARRGSLLEPWRERVAVPKPAGSWRAWIGVVTPFAGAALGVVAAAWAAKSYVSKVASSVDADQAPHDLDVFLRAASKVMHGASPYAFQHDQTYAYPPLLAYVAAPFHALGDGAATVAWTLLSLIAIALALWLLGVRDWRCYALTAAYPVTRSAVDLGTVGPLLLLAVAAAWRWRDSILQPAAAVGTAVALKLFLWPLAVWLALTRRIGAALAGVGFALALALIPWAAIGFAGLGHFPGVLRRLSHEEATSSYSGTALGVRAHLPETVALTLSLIVAAALLVAAWWFARDDRRSRRDRDVAALTLTLAAGLAASPIVWVHYFLLLLVPLALTRPRLSVLWLVPFAYYPLGETAWPAGDARKLALGLVTTVVLIVATVRRRSGDSAPVVAAVQPARVPARPARLTRAR